MATFAVTTTPTQVASGSSRQLFVNRGSAAIVLTWGVGRSEVLYPGETAASAVFAPGAAVFASTRSNTSSIEVTLAAGDNGLPGTSGVTLDDLAPEVTAAFARSTATAYVDNFIEDATNAAAGITAAAATVGDGGTLIFGPRTYTYASLPLTQAGLTLKGAGRGLTVLQQAAGSTGIAVDVNPTGATFKQPFTVEDLDISGVAGSSHGLRVRYASVVNLTNVRISGCGGDGLRTYETTATVIINPDIRGNGGNGITLGKKSDALTILGGSVIRNTGWGIQPGADTAEEAGGNGRVNAVLVMGTTMINNTAGAANPRFAGSNGIKFTACYLENNGGASGSQVKVGVSGSGNTVYPIKFEQCYFNGAASQARAIDVYDCAGITLEGCFFEGHTAGALKLNVAGTPWNWQYNTLATGYAVQDAAGVTYAAADLSSRAVYNELKFGPASRSGVAEIAIDRNDTNGNNAVRVVQAGAGVAGAALLAVQADGTTTSQRAAYFRSKGTGAVAIFADATGTILDISTGGKLGFFGTAAIARPTSTPAAATDAATTQALANDLRIKLLALGLIS